MSITRKKSSLNIFKINPQYADIPLTEIKKKKQEQYHAKKIKSKVENELKFIMKKDESLMKQYLKRKQDLVKQKEKQIRFINDMRHKEWLQEQQSTRLQQQKMETQKLKQKLRQDLTSANQKLHSNKKKIADNTKNVIRDWKLQKCQSQQRLLQLNKSRFYQTQTRRNLSRESQRSMFQQKHSRIVERSLHEIQKSKKQFSRDQKKINSMEKQLIDIKRMSQSRIKQIQKLKNDIYNMKNDSLSLSKVSSTKYFPRNPSLSSRYKSTQQNKNNDQNEKTCDQRSLRESRKCSLPLIHNKLMHDSTQSYA